MRKNQDGDSEEGSQREKEIGGGEKGEGHGDGEGALIRLGEGSWKTRGFKEEGIGEEGDSKIRNEIEEHLGAPKLNANGELWAIRWDDEAGVGDKEEEGDGEDKKHEGEGHIECSQWAASQVIEVL